MGAERIERWLMILAMFVAAAALTVIAAKPTPKPRGLSARQACALSVLEQKAILEAGADSAKILGLRDSEISGDMAELMKSCTDFAN